jgi:hypothetical protein
MIQEEMHLKARPRMTIVQFLDHLHKGIDIIYSIVLKVRKKKAIKTKKEKININKFYSILMRNRAKL